MTPFFGKTSYKTTAINFLLNYIYGKVFPIPNKTLLNLIPFNTGMENALFYARCNCLNVDDKGRLMINANISNISHSVLQANSTSAVKSNPYAPSNARPAESPSSIVTISPQAQLASIGSRYDVTNMSSKEMESMAGELKDSGQINFTEYLSLTLVITPPEGSHDTNAKINYLDQFKNQLEFSKLDTVNQNGHTQMLEKLTSLLQNLQDYNVS